MGSKLTLKNGQDQEFSIVHNDNAGAITIASDKIVFKDANGNIVLPSGSKIQGDFSNATVSSRTVFQTSNANTHSVVSVLPSGTGNFTAIEATNSSDNANCSVGYIAANGTTDVRIVSNIRGTGSMLPLTFYTGGAERMRIDTSGNVAIGTGGYMGYGRLGIGAQVGISCSGSDAITARGIQFFIDGVKHGNLSVDNYNNLLYVGNGFGYGTGSGGTVVQATSKSTPVTLNKPTGLITMNSAALAAGASVSFILNNTLAGSNDVSIATSINGNYEVRSYVTVAGLIYIKVTNISGATLSDALGINFTIIKGATA